MSIIALNEKGHVRECFLGGFRVFEVGILVFPVLATLLVAVAFLLGGYCDIWQWWGAVIGACLCMLGMPGASIRERWGGVVVFLFLLLFLWILAGCWAGQSVDESEYRFPAIRMMMLGWNPVHSPSWEKTVWGLEAFEGCRAWHVFYMARGVEMFCALFALALKAPLALSLGLPALLLAPVIRSILGVPGFSKRNLVVVTLLFGGGLALPEGVVDNVICLAAVGLLVSMYRVLCGRSIPWLRLFVFSFWMMVAKQSGLCTCFVFWALFSVAWCWQRRAGIFCAVRPLFLLCVGLASAFLLVGLSPYVTSWRNHGHPLWPTYTKASEEAPCDLTADFLIRNSDAQKMGHVGLFVNAYVSETLSLAFYRVWHGVRIFSPHCQTWRQGNGAGTSATSPTNPSTRILLVCSTMLILLLGCRRERWFLVLPWGGLFLFPSWYLGYLRYVPWWTVLPMFASLVALRKVESFLGSYFWGLCVLLAGCGIGAFLFRQVPAIDAAWELAPYLVERRILHLGATKSENRFNLMLLKESHPALRDASVLEIDAPNALGEAQVFRPFLFPQVGFVVDEMEHPRRASLAKVNENPVRARRYICYLTLIPRVYLVELPALVGLRLKGLL